MNKSGHFDQKTGLTLFFFLIAFGILSWAFFHECRRLAVSEAEKSLAGFLLTHRAIRSFVEDVQKPEIYRLKKEHKLYQEYFSPRLLSSTFIARNIKDAQNRERRAMGLDEVYFKFASRNPRNPINQADADELELLGKFNRGDIIEFKNVVSRDQRETLYYALPIAPNRESCMHCHGEPSEAPVELIERYGDQAGFHEKVGEIRALMSVRIPLAGLLAGARRTAIVLSLVALILLSAAFWVVSGFMRRLSRQQLIAVEKSDYLNSILQSSKDTAIIAGDANGCLRYFNQTAEKMFGVLAVEVVDQDLVEFSRRFAGQQEAVLTDAVRQAKEHGLAVLQLESQGRSLELRVSKIRPQERSAGFLIMARDITDSLQAEREREEISSRLQKAEKMESIGLMAGGVAHDLNNILSGIISYPELLLRRLPEDSPHRRQVEAIRQSGLRAAAVVADLLTVARGVASRKEVHDLNLILGEYFDSPEFLKLQESHTGVEFRRIMAPEELSFTCSPVHIKKCLMNLLHNAAEAMDVSGCCMVESGCRFFSSTEAQKYRVDSGDYVFVLISDNGPGIGVEHLSHIFEPFYSTKKMGRSGTGLGLSVVWNTVKEHGGVVTVDSGIAGSVFGLYFPLTHKRVAAVEPENSLTAGLSTTDGRGQKVLVVDDEEQMRDIALQMLGELNYQAFAVNSGEEALDFLANNQVDLVMLDMLMEPGINGRQTYEKISRLNPGQKALIVSGFSASEDVAVTLRLGAGAFLGKPYSLDQLARALGQVLQG